MVGSTITRRATPNDGRSMVSSKPVFLLSRYLQLWIRIADPSMVYTNDTTATAVFSDDDTAQTVTGSYAW